MFPTLESIKADFPNSITADANEGLVRKWLEELPADKKTVIPWDDERHSQINTYIQDDVIETDEQYPQCNYCVGGALQMAFGETEPSLRDDWKEGVFPAVDVLADSLHYFCNIPYAGVDDVCPFAFGHEDKDCLTRFPTSTDVTAYELADELTRANDRGDFDYAWSCVEVALNYKENN